ncbi:MAG: TlpA disulfide reductase family protein [Deltaproteobacteria bacterium]|nr:TlpA disulfide reductase family protein [Deltaproteobacteria bacterium]
MSRAWKPIAIVAALAALQLGLLVAVRSRSSSGEARALNVEAVADAPLLPALLLDARGEKRALTTAGRVTLVHVWATWCKPCREELPELLALQEDGVVVVAVSVDESWEVIDHFFAGRAPANVVRASHDEVRASFGVDKLPTTFVVDAGGRIRFRLAGGQPWNAGPTRAWLAAQGRSSAP